MIIARTFTIGYVRTVDDAFHRRSIGEGVQKGDPQALMNIFTAGSTYDPATKTMLVFATISYAEPVMKTFSTAS
jgi:hypothetical protein